jgi:hypothetical protein
MRRAKVLGATLVVMSAIASANPAQAQTVGADLALFSSYVWRGLSLTNKPVAEPDLYVTFPAGKASITLGGWANIDLGKYDDQNNDISESGGLSSFNFAEFDPWAEVGIPVGKATVTLGATAYIYPNKVDNQSATFVPTPGLLTTDLNTVEIYGKLAIDAPLSPKISAYYDVDHVKGLYVEGSISHSIPASEKVSVTLGALAGVNAGQGINDSKADEGANFFDSGFTHLDLSAGVPITAGIVSITPALHLVINGDDFTKITSPTKTDKDVKLWGGATISWSKSYGAAAEEESSDSTQ